MKKAFFLFGAFLFSLCLFAQKKAKLFPLKTSAAATVSTVSTAVQGTWMYGHFSLTEYWSTSPRTYLGNAFTFAVAFSFKADGTYEQYFTSGVNNYGVSTFHQSVTKGTYKVDEATNTISTLPASSHYKRTSLGRTEEDRDMKPSELSGTVYTYITGSEPNGTQALYLTMKRTQNALTFLKKAL